MAQDAADVAARTMALAMVMSKCYWLQSLGLPPEVQPFTHDLSFEGTTSSLEQMDSKLHGLKDLRATLTPLDL